MPQTEAQKRWYLENRERILEKANQKYVKKGPRPKTFRSTDEYKKEYRKKYREENREIIKEYQQTIRQTSHFKKLKCNREAKRRAKKLNATPRWANLEKIKEIYMNCPDGYHVDHIIPLQGKNVSGLHVESNLQYLTASDNCSKSNSWEV